ncbi:MULTISPECIES: ammonium transporter [Hyphomonas]|nr:MULTISPECIES: ammonium transporter [Hyphomonas]MBB39339.1 ammonium transporter [Hyphomonas sp.]HAE27361.1 ammonium transporter [Hyphomonas adhaerens]|tara:strand:+ start:247 stop:1635 length:1389 start_codon:yes stop_codon:yes gene_type:complete
MGQLLKRMTRGVALLPVFAISGALAYAQDADLEARLSALEESVSASASSYVDNSYLFLIGGIIVMLMAAGFLCLEVGLVRSKNAAMQSMKNVLLYSIAGLMFWVVGYNMAYPGESIMGLVGTTPGPWAPPPLDQSHGDYAASSDWFFQMVFVATAASIVSGTVAERVKLWGFLAFTAVLTAFIYPIVVSWEWGGGYLDSEWAFSDFAGSTLVHSVGGWAALMGAIIIGPRTGKYFGKQIHPMPGSNIPLAGLGTFLLWFGWFGFNGASELAAGGIQSINDVAAIFANTNMAAVGGVLAATVTTAVLYKGKVDATMVFNGAIGGLVSITAEPLAPSMGASVLIGAVGGVLVVVSVPLLDKFKIDDVVGAIPAHLVCGIWGTLIVAASYGNHVMPVEIEGELQTSYFGQLVGVLLTGVFVSVASVIVWMALKVTIGIRATEEEEMAGMDVSEVGIEAYPDFTNA